MYRRKAVSAHSLPVLQRLGRLCNGTAAGLPFDVHNAIALEAQMRRHSPELYAAFAKSSATQLFYPKHIAAEHACEGALLFSLPLPQHLVDGDEDVATMERRTFYHASSLRDVDALRGESAAAYAPRCGLTGLFYTREEVVDNLQAAAAELGFQSPFWLTADHPGLRSGYLALKDGSEAICVSLTSSVVSIAEVGSLDAALLHPSLRRRTHSGRDVAELDAPHACGMNAISGFVSRNPHVQRMPHNGLWLSLDQLLRHNLRLATSAEEDKHTSAPRLIEVARWELHNADQLCSPGRLAVQHEPCSEHSHDTTQQPLFHAI